MIALRRILAATIVLLLSMPPHACGTGWSPIGFRAGCSLDGKDKGAQLYEFFGTYQLPWSLRNRAGWGVATEAALTAGSLRTDDDTGFIGTLGPAFLFGNPDFPLELDLGISLAFISRDKYGRRDYNGLEQFVSHAEFLYRLSPRFALSYRFQHMSNAGFNGGVNPGINVHLLGVNWYPRQHPVFSGDR